MRVRTSSTQASISERVHALEDHVAQCEKTMGIKVKDLRDLNDALANKQAEYAKYEAAADKKSQELQGTIDTTVCASKIKLKATHHLRWRCREAFCLRSFVRACVPCSMSCVGERSIGRATCHDTSILFMEDRPSSSSFPEF
jgi:hypothetical protein